VNGIDRRIQQRLRISGILIILGLIVEALSLIRIGPLPFLAFMFIGGTLLIVGVAVYLYSLVKVTTPSSSEGDRP
jgi:predicted membrane channel-forming protein YqfA (hemolysin III family)